MLKADTFYGNKSLLWYVYPVLQRHRLTKP